jgi:hypothetical protein
MHQKIVAWFKVVMSLSQKRQRDRDRKPVQAQMRNRMLLSGIFLI